MVKVTFEIKTNIYFEEGKKKVLLVTQVTHFFAMWVIGNNFLRLASIQLIS